MDFYMNQIQDLLKTYEPGRPNMKPDVLMQMVAIEKKRKKDMELAQQAQKAGMPTITLKQGDGPPQELNIDQIMAILQQQQAQIIHLTNLLEGKDTEIKILTETLLEYMDKEEKEC